MSLNLKQSETGEDKGKKDASLEIENLAEIAMESDLPVWSPFSTPTSSPRKGLLPTPRKPLLQNPGTHTQHTQHTTYKKLFPDTQQPQSPKRKKALKEDERTNREKLMGDQSIWNLPETFSPYINIRATDGSNITTKNIFTLNKELKKTGIHLQNNIEKKKNGTITIKCRSKNDADSLLGCQHIGDTPVEVSPDKRLNSSKGVVKNREFESCSVDDMKTIHGVTDAFQFTANINGERRKVGTWLLTFDSIRPPTYITAAYLTGIAVEPYIPKPLQCKNCYGFGHKEKFCRNKKQCHTCGTDCELGHTCQSTLCKNCKSTDHDAKSKVCPEYIKQVKIIEHQATHGGTFFEIRNLLYPRVKTYAKVTHTTQHNQTNNQHNNTNTNFKSPLPAKERKQTTTVVVHAAPAGSAPPPPPQGTSQSAEARLPQASATPRPKTTRDKGASSSSSSSSSSSNTLSSSKAKNLETTKKPSQATMAKGGWNTVEHNKKSSTSEQKNKPRSKSLTRTAPPGPQSSKDAFCNKFAALTNTDT